VIPLDGRPHLSAENRHYLAIRAADGDGDTLVVETTNFHPNGNAMGGLFRFADQNLTLTERFTRSGPTAITYEFTVTDPRCGRSRGRRWCHGPDRAARFYEYACHEGNYSIANMLSVARFEEKAHDRTGQPEGPHYYRRSSFYSASCVPMPRRRDHPVRRQAASFTAGRS